MSTNGDEVYTLLIIMPFSPKSMSITHNPFYMYSPGRTRIIVFLFQLFAFAWADANYRVPTGVDGTFINCGVGWNEPSGVMVTDR